MPLKFKYAILILLSFLIVSVPTEFLSWKFSKDQVKKVEMENLRMRTESVKNMVDAILKSRVFHIGKLIANTAYVGEFPEWLVSQTMKHASKKDEFIKYPKNLVYIENVENGYITFIVKSDDEQNLLFVKVDIFKLFEDVLPDYIRILDSDGRILFHPEKQMVGRNLQETGMKELYDCYNKKMNGYCVYTYKEKKIGHFSRLSLPGKVSLYVITLAPYKKILELPSLISKVSILRTIVVALLIFLVMLPFTSSVVKKLKRFMNPLKEIVDVTNNLVEDLAASSEELASSVESMEKNAQNVTDEMTSTLDVVNEGEEEIRKSTETIENIANGLKDSSSSLGELIKVSELMEKITGTIKTISERINILSINAEIEASRKEIDPRAFEALSREIGKLAMETQQKLSSIEDSILNLRKTIESVSDLNEKIANESSHIMDAISKIHNVMKKMKDSISSLERHFVEVSEASQDILAGSEQVAASAQHLKGVANKTQKNIKDLEKELSKI